MGKVGFRVVSRSWEGRGRCDEREGESGRGRERRRARLSGAGGRRCTRAGGVSKCQRESPTKSHPPPPVLSPDIPPDPFPATCDAAKEIDLTLRDKGQTEATLYLFHVDHSSVNPLLERPRDVVHVAVAVAMRRASFLGFQKIAKQDPALLMVFIYLNSLTVISESTTRQ